MPPACDPGAFDDPTLRRSTQRCRRQGEPTNRHEVSHAARGRSPGPTLEALTESAVS